MKMKKQIKINIPSNKLLNIEAFISTNHMFITQGFKRVFSTTIIKHVKSGVLSEVDKLIEKSKAFDKNLSELKSITEKHTLLEQKLKLDNLKNEEWLKQSEFMKKYIPYLNENDRKKLIDSLDQGETMDELVKKKLDKLNLSTDSSLHEFKESMKLSELTYSNKYKIFSKIESLFKFTIDNSKMSRAEKDAFYVLSAKRNQEKEKFLDFKNKHFNTLNEKIDNALKNYTDVKPSTFKTNKPYPTDHKPSSVGRTTWDLGVYNNKGSMADSSYFTDKPPISEEILDVVKELLEYFS
jgi:hypothetical protein